MEKTYQLVQSFISRGELHMVCENTISFFMRTDKRVVLKPVYLPSFLKSKFLLLGFCRFYKDY